MSKLHYRAYWFIWFTLLACLGTAAVPARAGDETWQPISPSELAQKSSLVEKEADAEAIFWEVRADDKSDDKVVFKHYLRIKIFNERGRSTFSKLEFPQTKGIQVKDIAVRVTKPDGSVTELTKSDLLERTVVKANGLKIKVTSLAVPGLADGAILEYRYKQVIEDGSIGRLEFQRDIPVQRVTYYVRPHKGLSVEHRKYNMPPDVGLTPDKDGFSRVTMTNVPAFREEPYMPPEDEVRPWMRISYGLFNLFGSPYALWAEVTESFMKKSDEANRLAPQIIANATTPEEKLRRIYDFCQKEIKNLTFDKKLTAEDRKKYKENKTANDVLKQRAGNWLDINGLFITLARSAGFSAYLALPSDRSERFYTQENVSETRLFPHIVAVQMGADWKFYDPSTPYLPFEAIPWYREGSLTYIARGFNGIWGHTPLTSAEKSQTKRTGKFKLLPDGALEGEVKVELTGHPAYKEIAVHGEDSPEQREKELREELAKRLSAAEASNFKIEDPQTSSQSPGYAYRVRVPGYAQVVGKRIFFQPNFFTYGDKPLFTAAERKHNVHFDYAWSEQDRIEIELPAGYQLDNAEQPPVITSGDLCQDKVEIGVVKDTTTLVYKRHFFFGRGAILLFGVAQYPAVKTLFEKIHQTDTYALALKQSAPAPQ